MNLDRNLTPYTPAVTNLVDRLRFWAEHQAGQPAFIYLNEQEEATELTYSGLDRQARAIAARLTAMGLNGERALLLFPPGLEFVAAFFGCLYAGTTAVPAFPPRRNRNMSRVEAISDDAQAAVVLSIQDVIERSESVLDDDAPHLKEVPWLATDKISPELADAWFASELDDNTLAVLQYTSGSTGRPKGVMLTHANLMHNCKLITYGFEADRESMGLSWLPTYHDMGLVGGILNPLYIGRPSVLMSPMSFLQKPVRWLQAISRFNVSVSGGPNFAYALCNEKITEEDCEGLDLSSWNVAFNGAEPVRADTLAKFTEKFKPYGFRAETHYPCYGMAETTLIISGAERQKRPVVRTFDAKALESNRVVAVPDGSDSSRQLVASGRVLPDQQVLIVDLETCEQLSSGHVGEIWVESDSVAQGYWNNEEDTKRVFHGRLANNSEGQFLRTGDLGFLQGNQLFVTGRTKDLIIINGRNLYPHDIELIVERAHEAIRLGGGVAFSIDAENTEKLVIAQELERKYRKYDTREIAAAIRKAVFEISDVVPHTIMLLKIGKLPKTSSGKVQRRACRDQFLSGDLDVLAQWQLGDEANTHDVNDIPAMKRSTSAAEVRSVDSIQSWLVHRIAERLDTPASHVDVNDSFAHFGLDSVALIGISGELEDWLGRIVSPKLLFNYPTIAELSEHLAISESIDTSHSVHKPSIEQSEPIAIVGLGCRFPGADSVDEYWRLLRDGVDAVGEVPDDRWDIERFYDPAPDVAGKMYTRCGGFLSDVSHFDPHFFNIAPREAETLDPQQRLLLEVCWETLEDAGQSPEKLIGTDTGVFVGISNSDYSRLQQSLGQYDAIDAYTGTGSLNSVAAGRIAYVLGLHGPTMAIDTACSSALVAVHQAIRSLRNGECRAALTGGVNLILEPSSSITLSAMRALSADGRCKTFDDSADGFVRGEGCGMVLLKRHADALADGDRILGLIRGSATNHDGRSNGLTAPHGPSQESLIRKALADADVDPNLVTYVEAHGTGTSLGDPIEVQSLDAVFGDCRSDENRLMVGSVKTNIGHLESAAGIASLIKVVLALRHGEIPPNLHFDNPNTYIPWDQTPITVPVELMSWPKIDERRIAGISSFGFSGTNAHLIVESAPETKSAESQTERPLHLLVLSAKSKVALKDLANRYRVHFGTGETDFRDVCSTAATGRSHLSHRLAIIAKDAKQCCEKLEAVANGKFVTGATDGTVSEQERLRTAFLFTGQGSQFVDMGRGLYETQPSFRRVLDECDQVLKPVLERSLLSVMFSNGKNESLLNETAYTQPALFAIECALYELWKSWGIYPEILLGHSVGEFAAAYAAGVFSLEDGLKLIAARGRLMQSLPRGGTMISLECDEATARSAIVELRSKVSIAALNGPEQTVISGPHSAAQAVAKKLQTNGICNKPLKVSHAFHSASMDPILDEFAEICGDVSLSIPNKPIVSNMDGQVVSNEIATAAYWRDQIRQPVRFMDGIAEIHRLGFNAYVELGPNPTLTALAQQCIPSQDQLWLSSLRYGHDDWNRMLGSLSELHVRGATVDWKGFDRNYVRRKVTAPTYPFQRKRYWFNDVSFGNGRNDKLAVPLSSSSGQSAKMDYEFYQIHWLPKSRLEQQVAQRSRDYIPSPSQIAERVRPEIDRLELQTSSKRYREFEAELDELSVVYILSALKQLGWSPEPGERFYTSSLFKSIGVGDQHRQLFTRMLDILQEDGRLRWRDGQWVVTGNLQKGADPAAIKSQLLLRFPECNAELNLFHQCGQNLAEVLSGAADPLQVLFPDGSSAMVESLYKDSPFARTLNTLVEEVVCQSLDDLPPNRTIKILEIGAGTGGTTAQILPRLPADRTEYVFTDVAEIFTRDAQRKFADYPFVRYRALDIESDPSEQGFAANQFDLVLAANVLHATEDLKQTTKNVRQLLAPNGTLVILEGTRPQRWLDLTFGMTDGWWRFTDTDLRPNHALLSSEHWIKLLGQSGFESAVALPGTSETDRSGIVAPHAAIVGQANRQKDQRQAAGQQIDDANRLGCWIILADQGGVSERLAESLVERGASPILVSVGNDFRQLDDDHFEIRVNRSEDLLKVFNNIAEIHSSPIGIVHLSSLDSVEFASLSAESLNEAHSLGCTLAINAVQAATQARFATSPKFWFVTSGAQSVGDSEQVPGLAQSPLWGLGRVLSDEQPQMWGGLIDLDPLASVESASKFVADELLSPDGEDQLAFRADQRFAARLDRRRESGTIKEPLRWRVDASYLISGGLGELGLTVARRAVQQGARTLILLGRTKFPPREDWSEVAKQDKLLAAQIESIHELEALGARVKIAAVDVADEHSVVGLLETLDSEGCPPIRGVIHAAGIAEAQALIELDSEYLARVLRPKITGTWVLYQLLRNARLDFFVNFSPGAALLGSPMLGSYGAANAFQDSFAHAARADGRPMLSINWGFWDEVGMVARSQREIGRGFSPQGMQSLSPHQGLAAMEQLLEQHATQAAVMPVDWAEWGRFHPRAIEAPLFRNLVIRHSISNGDQETEDADWIIDRDVISAATPDRQVQLIQNFLSGQLSRVARIPVEQLDPNQPLNNLGIDSLMAVELRNHIQSKLGIAVPVASMLQGPSVAQLAGSLLEQLSRANGALSELLSGGASQKNGDDRADDVETIHGASASEVLAKLDDLSEADVDKMLQNMMDLDTEG